MYRNNVEDIFSLNKDVITLDTETTGLNPRKDKLRLIQLHDGDKSVVLDLFKEPLTPEYISHINNFFNDVRVIAGHNIKFDLQFCWSYGIDTDIAARLVENHIDKFEVGHFRLDRCTDRYLHNKIDKELQKSDWSGKLSEEQITYALNDVIWTHKLYYKLKQELIDNKLVKVAVIEFKAIPAIASMEYNGFYIDTNHWKNLIPLYEERVAKL